MLCLLGVSSREQRVRLSNSRVDCPDCLPHLQALETAQQPAASRVGSLTKAHPKAMAAGGNSEGSRENSACHMETGQAWIRLIAADRNNDQATCHLPSWLPIETPLSRCLKDDHKGYVTPSSRPGAPPALIWAEQRMRQETCASSRLRVFLPWELATSRNMSPVCEQKSQMGHERVRCRKYACGDY